MQKLRFDSRAPLTQLVTVDLDTGEHRFQLPHLELCGVESQYSNFNAGRARQWAGLVAQIDENWRSSKWAAREWRPLVSLNIAWPRDHAANCKTPREVVWAGSHGAGARDRISDRGSGSWATHLRRTLLLEARRHLATADPSSIEWVGNLTAHVEQPGRGQLPGRQPNAWLLFPSYHGQREAFNGYCGDTTPADEPCHCTAATSSCGQPPCQGKRLCAPLPRGSARIVEGARSVASSLGRMPSLLGTKLGRVRLTPSYDDCWDGRDRCQGYRPCRERLDAMCARSRPSSHPSCTINSLVPAHVTPYTTALLSFTARRHCAYLCAHRYICRSTALLCPKYRWSGGWKAALAHAKRWIPPKHRSASLLYLYDGQTQDAADVTFRSWTPHTIGYDSDAIIFGPQFANARSVNVVRRSLGLLRTALDAADSCGNSSRPTRTLALFRSPAFNFDPVNTFRESCFTTTSAGRTLWPAGASPRQHKTIRCMQ